MNVFMSSDLSLNFNTTHRIHKYYSGVIDFKKAVIYTTDSLRDRQFVDYAIRVGAEVRVITVKPFLIDFIVKSLSEKLNFVIFCSAMDNYFYSQLWEACDLKGIPIRRLPSSVSEYL